MPLFREREREKEGERDSNLGMPSELRRYANLIDRHAVARSAIERRFDENTTRINAFMRPQVRDETFGALAAKSTFDLNAF